MSIAVQTAIGEIGEKATTDLSFNFKSMIDCGGFQYGLNESGIFLLNSGNNINEQPFLKSITLATSNFGIPNYKWIRYLYLLVEVFGYTTFTASIRPNRGNWVNKVISTEKAGLKTLSFTMQRENGQGNYHNVKISSYQQFKIHEIKALLVVRNMGINRG
jgi:hypothetical protein